MVIELKTGYEWCLQENLRLLELSQWPTQKTFSAESYYEEKITFADFHERISKCKIKVNSIPRKTDLYLEYRMYGLVAYQLSGTIHAGIQFGHAVVEYGQFVKDIPPFEIIYNKFANKDKTFIILNGGTTNENPNRLGTLQQHVEKLKNNNILIAEFREPDLNDTLTAVVFLVDERVFNKSLYPDFVKDEKVSDKTNEKQYNEWVEKIGGQKNVFLREFLPNFRLA
jgi:hypothetical protein